MKKKSILSLLLATILATSCTVTPVRAAGLSSQESRIKDGVDTRPRAIITTDLECDDMNSLLHLSLFFNDVDVDGIIYSASQFHFTGDGVHTLAEVNPNYCCTGYKGETHKEIENFKSYRPMELGWIENVWANEYASVYNKLKANDLDYPSPKYLTSITKVGNVQFEGDVRFNTEGSDLIKNAILDDDPRPLYLFSWGGFNTVARALLSIHDDYKDNPEGWNAIRNKVYNKVIISGYSQDYSYRDYINKLYPDLKLMATSDNYQAYFASENAPIDARYTFQADWLTKNIKFNHGALMSKYGLMGDGTHYEGEPDINQYGETTTIDWTSTGIPLVVKMNQYDFLGEGDSAGFMSLINVGLRGQEANKGNCGTYSGKISYEKPKLISFNDQMNLKPEATTDYNIVTGEASNSTNQYLLDYQKEWAARADWCVKSYQQANHAPVVNVENKDITAKPGAVVPLNASITDPDGNTTNQYWVVDEYAGSYSGDSKNLRVWDVTSPTTYFTIPKDATKGDQFIITLHVTDNAETPMTRYAQVIVTIN